MIVNGHHAIFNYEMVAGASTLASSAIEVVAKTKSPIVQCVLFAVADHPKEFERELKKTKVTGVELNRGA